jgi:hypothetical protein
MFTLFATYRDFVAPLALGAPPLLTDNNPEGASVAWEFLPDGTGRALSGGSVVNTFSWIRPAQATYADNYELGVDYSETFNFSWSALTSTQSVGASIGAASGAETGGVQIAFRRVGDSQPTGFLAFTLNYIVTSSA